MKRKIKLDARFALALCGLGLPGLVQAAGGSAADADEAAHAARAGAATVGMAAAAPLFGAGPLAFAAPRGKPPVVGVYVLGERPPESLAGLAPGSATHLLYAFLRLCGPGQLARDAAGCVGRDDFEIAADPARAAWHEAFVRRKQREPGLRVLASVGGWGGSDPIFHMVGDARARSAFVASVLRFLAGHPGFDGIDIDWEHPGSNGAVNGVALGSGEDGRHFATLMNELRLALDGAGRAAGRRYLLTAAVNATREVIDRIDFRSAAPALDLVFMMSYDYYGGWSTVAGHHAALHPSGPAADDGLSRSVRSFVDAGVPASKLVAGVAMYGRGFKGVVRPQTGAAFSAVFPAGDGSLPYREIASRYLDARGRGRLGFESRFDPQTGAWSLFDAGQGAWIGYDDPRAVLAKGRYAIGAGLAGVFAWELSQDNGDLLNAMNRGIGRQPVVRSTGPMAARPTPADAAR